MALLDVCTSAEYVIPHLNMQASPRLAIIHQHNNNKAAAHAEKGTWRVWLAVACSGRC